ncbi:MAG: hypothetical protein AUK24_03170 [Syntrophaceae bacterium CG2_30_49_12]|nr:MAG: hypothetical protein AUK24_03170 [Syntrophaceae bacterium CG2_30_49_12]PJA47980.1 MAG: hypothetical protein CO171_08450 [Syntrophobacterales bacterium CG_4_9_14_3_um_filter_49_8]PJC73582.1 MAG: hypothetical protein CO012_08830 [Syntrophobacterales bacterium CG_4_8_14_3_um_filter_49_14]
MILRDCFTKSRYHIAAKIVAFIRSTWGGKRSKEGQRSRELKEGQRLFMEAKLKTANNKRSLSLFFVNQLKGG